MFSPGESQGPKDGGAAEVNPPVAGDGAQVEGECRWSVLVADSWKICDSAVLTVVPVHRQMLLVGQFVFLVWGAGEWASCALQRDQIIM